jgi:hypothetical protein
MNVSVSSSSFRRWLARLALPLVLLSSLALVIVGVTSYFRLDRDARCLRNSLTKAIGTAPGAWNKKIELNVGPLTLVALRTGLSFVPLHPEARTALRAVQGAQVGIYKLGADAAGFSPATLLHTANEAMAARGWDCVVGVANRDDVVAVYVPRQLARGGRLRACVAVLNRDQLVVAAGRTDLDPLIELAMNHPEWKKSRHWMAAQL